ncbi:MAG TPA: hypothetical protein VJB90_04335 [Candidatus Nanoarchaeia archaeon]|nr:hypothetical protein [Candidatus Nanoarchaeia archaeon]
MKPQLVIQILAAVLAATAFTLFLSFIMGTISDLVFWISMAVLGFLAFGLIPNLRKRFGLDE